MAEQKKLVMPPEVKRIYELGRVFQALPADGRVWAALEEIISASCEQSHAKVVDPDTPEDKRAFWGGANYSISDLHVELRALQSGAWREWPLITEWRKQADGDAEEGE
jgi:hypothetical protein